MFKVSRIGTILPVMGIALVSGINVLEHEFYRPTKADS